MSVSEPHTSGIFHHVAYVGSAYSWSCKFNAIAAGRMQNVSKILYNFVSLTASYCVLEWQQLWKTAIKDSTDDQVLQGCEISSSECAACFGLYEDDVNDDGDVTCDWIQCTNEQCSLWMHTTCLDKSDGEYLCAVCQIMFC